MTGLTGESFGAPANVTSTETALESDTSATAVTSGTGEMVWSGIVPGGTNNLATLASNNDLGFDLIGEQILTVIARRVSYETQTARIACITRFKEEW